ncbi:filamin A-interacting protein 1-like isoform X1 [Galleria mellonella]|uniref:Filamin A-interacting protein 1-like isoform X1 n=1 Tax=Galleria mellonella TaxID=7137 RepID=A0A6J3BT78_GALME|nr:filamin A-interacting protein 1-like isoform X1 [Galleria mellonella]
MADSAQPQVSGGGEGTPVVSGDAKQADSAQPQVSGGGEGAPVVSGEAKKADLAQPQVSGTGEAVPIVSGEAKQPDQPVAEEQSEVKKVEQVVEGTKTEAPQPEPVKPEALVSEQIKNEELPPTPAVEETNKEEAKPAQEPANEAKVEQNVPPKDIAMHFNEHAAHLMNWQQRELELLKKIDELEKVKNQRSEDGLKLELKVREEEIDLLKARVRNLETELQAALSKPSGKNHEMIENIKQQHEELLSKARGMIFDKTKMVKNQELQIEALTTQVQSLKDINLITKDLLEIRNSEVKAMEDRLQAMEARFKAEKDKYGLVLQRAQTSTNINVDLRKEYETQLGIFKELREKYEQRVQALVAENTRLKESVRGGTS